MKTHAALHTTPIICCLIAALCLLLGFSSAQATPSTPPYTNDGGHLNEKGREKVAEQLLLHLVNTM